jgi:hypothetical protein
MFQLPEFLYHATMEKNLDSILEFGLKTEYYGAIHGEMAIHPPKSIYLSRFPNSNNLHTKLFEEPVVVFKISTKDFDYNSIYPDDFIYDLFANEEILRTSKQVQKALGVSDLKAKMIFNDLIHALDKDLPELLKPFGPYWLSHKLGGEIAYARDISAQNIIEFTPHPNSQSFFKMS